MEGILNTLKTYETDKGTPFWWYTKQYHIPEAIHDFIRLARPGFTVQCKDEYDTLRKVMWLYQDLKNADADPIKRIAAENGISEKRVKEYLQAGMRNMSLISTETQETVSDFLLGSAAGGDWYSVFKVWVRLAR